MTGATPWPMAGPRDQGRHAAPAPPPPTADERHHQGAKGPPQTHPPPPPAQTRGQAGGGPPTPPPPPHPPQQGRHRRGPPPPQGRGGAPPQGERRLGLLPRTHTGVPGQRARRSRKEGVKSDGAPGGAVHGPPLTPPTTGRNFSPDRKRAPEGSAPATRREPGRSTTGRRLEREQGGRGATPPPPPPHRPAGRRGPGPHPPRLKGRTPPPGRGAGE